MVARRKATSVDDGLPDAKPAHARVKSKARRVRSTHRHEESKDGDEAVEAWADDFVEGDADELVLSPKGRPLTRMSAMFEDQSPVARHREHAMYKSLAMSLRPDETVDWFSLYELLPLKTSKLKHEFIKKRDNLKRPLCLDQGGRPLLWHAVRRGDETACRLLLDLDKRYLNVAQGITHKDKKHKLSACDLAVVFSHNRIILLLEEALTMLKKNTRCNPYRVVNLQRQIQRLDVSVRPADDTAWLELYSLMPVRGEQATHKFDAAASQLAEQDYLGCLDQNGASLVWHAIRLEDEQSLRLLLAYEQTRQVLGVADRQFKLDAITLAHMIENKKIFFTLGSHILRLLYEVQI